MSLPSPTLIWMSTSRNDRLNASLTAIASRSCPWPVRGADRYGVGIPFQNARELVLSVQVIDLVQHQQRVFLLNADFLEYVKDRGNLVVDRRVAGIRHVQQQVRLT